MLLKIDYLETEHLILRKAKESDLEAIWNNIWKDKNISDNMLWPVTPTLEEAKERLRKTMNYQSEHYAYFVCLKDTDEAIGFAGVREYDEDSYEDSGLCIATKYQRRGYAKEVLGALLKLVFEKLNKKRFIYGCFSTNDASRKVCYSYGFHYLESKPEVRDHDQFSFTSDNYYLTKEEYENR